MDPRTQFGGLADPLELAGDVRSYSPDTAVESLLRDESGLVAAGGHRRFNPNQANYLPKLVKAQRIIEAYENGYLPGYKLMEAMTTSDFPILFQDVLDRRMLARYAAAPVSWSMYMTESLVPDFRAVSRRDLQGADTTLDRVKERAPYPEAALTESQIGYAVGKFGRKFTLSWEDIVNDDLRSLRDIPDRFGDAAASTEELIATQIFCDANGPKASVFTSGNGNILQANSGLTTAINAPLSVSALQAAYNQMTRLTDSSGRRIAIRYAILVVPPELEYIANNILSPQAMIGMGSQTDAVHYTVPNWMANRFKIATNWYIPSVITSGNRANTSWFLFPDPAANRAFAEMGFLARYRQPQIFMKDADQRPINGGASNVMDGDFDTDGIRYKVRHVTGGGVVDAKLALASNGTGS